MKTRNRFVGGILTAALLLKVLPLHAELTQDQEMDIMVRSVLSDPEASKAAYLHARRLVYDRAASAQPALKNDARAREAYIMQKLRREEEAVDGESFKGGLIQEGLRELADHGKYVTAVVLKRPKIAILPKTATDAVADKFLDFFNRAPVEPNVKIEAQEILIKQIMLAAKNPKDPNSNYAKKLLQRMHLNPTVPLEYEPRISPNLQNARLSEELKDLRKLVKQLSEKTPSEDVKKQMTDASIRIIEIAHEDAKSAMTDAKSSIKSGARVSQADLELAQKWSGRLGDAASGLSVAAQAASLMGDQKTAEKLMLASETCSKVADVVSTTLTKSFAENPAMYANVYIAAAVVIKNLISASQEQSAMSVIMKQLQQIAKQIEDLRKEIHERFDLMDSKMNRYFDHSFVELVATQGAVNRLTTLVDSSIRDIEAQQFQIQTGMKHIWKSQIIDWKTRCFPDEKDVTANMIQRCRNQFALLATGQAPLSEEGALDTQTSVAQLSKLTQHEYSELKTVLAESSSSVGGVHPANWKQGASLFLKLFRDYPRFRSLAKYAGSAFNSDDRLGLNEVISQGEQIQQSLNNLLVEDSKLKTGVLEKLLRRYRQESLAAITEGQELIRERTGRGPNPFVGFQQNIVVDDSLDMFRRHIPFCPESEKRIKVGKFVHKFLEEPAIPNRARTPVEQLQATFKRDYLEIYHAPAYNWSPAFLPMFPKSLIWAARMGTDRLPGYEKIELSACFTRIEVPEFVNDANGVSVSFLFEMDVRATVGEGQNRRTFSGGRYVLNETKKQPRHVLGLGGPDRISLVANFWHGQICPGYTNCSFSWKPSVGSDPMARFKAVNPESPSAELTKFEDVFNRSLKRAADQVKKDLDIKYGPSKTSSRDLINLVVQLGLNPRQPSVEKFISYLNFEDTLPTPEAWARAASYGTVSSETLEKKLDNRIQNVQERIRELSSSHHLEARESGIESLVKELRQLEK